MGVSYGYLSQVSSGRRPWTPMMRERALAVLGEVPGQGVVYRQGGLVQGKGQSSYVRERAREKGLSLYELADAVGVSYGYMSQVSRGQRNLSPSLQMQMEAVLDATARVEPAERPTVDPSVLWERMDAHGWSQNEVARRVGISTGYLSEIMNGKRTPSGPVLRRLHAVLFAPTAQELVAPVELKVMAWKKGSRSGVVVKSAGGPGATASAPAGGCPGAPRWSSPTPRATTAGAGFP